MPRGCIRAKYVPLCPECGRILELFEFCECALRLPKDGLRATCPKFIARAGYTLTHSSKFDVIVEYFIKHENYNIHELNAVLFDHDQPLLCV